MTDADAQLEAQLNSYVPQLDRVAEALRNRNTRAALDEAQALHADVQGGCEVCEDVVLALVDKIETAEACVIAKGVDACDETLTAALDEMAFVRGLFEPEPQHDAAQ